MVRELVIQGWCDVCLGQREKVPSVGTFVVALNELEREVDLCTEHQTYLLEVQAFLEQYGNPVGGGPISQPASGTGQGPRRVKSPTGELVDKDAVEARTCPECLHVSPTRSAMRQHLKATHGTSLTELGVTSPRGRAAVQAKSQPALEVSSGAA